MSFLRIAGSLFSLSLVLLTQACSPVKGYPGPELPDTQISLIESGGEGFFDRESVDSMSLGPGGIAVLPGSHNYWMVNRVEMDRDCDRSHRTDYKKYKKCVKKGKNEDDCWDDNQETYEVCDIYYNSYECSGTLSTKAGRKYSLNFALVGNHGRMEVAENNRVLDVEQCSLVGKKSDVEEGYY